MNKENKEFILDLRDRLFKSNIKDACLNFMQLHPDMFSDTFPGDDKIMSIGISICICAKEEAIATDPGFITIELDKDNNYSEHFDSGNVYWNGVLEDDECYLS